MSCNKDKSQNEITNNNLVVFDSVNVKEVKLKPSETIVDDWAEIVVFENNLSKIQIGKVNEVKDIEALISALEALKESIPESFNSQPISVRIKVLETEILMLNQYLTDQDTKAVNDKISDVKQAYNIFVGQIEAYVIKEKDYEKYN